MNNNKKVITLILVVAIIQFTLSLFSKNFIEYFPSFKNVNLVTDILEKEKIIQKKKLHKTILPPILIGDSLVYNDFDAYLKKGTLIDFEADSTNPALKNFTDKLIRLANHKKVKIRIAWFGDSQIEGDLITQDVRELLQNYFGQQKGVGYVPITCVSADFRNTAKVITTGAIFDSNFKKQGANSNLFLSGYSVLSPDLTVFFKDNVAKSKSQITQKWLLYGKGDSISINRNEVTKKYNADKEFNRILIDSSTLNKINFQVSSKNTPLYGISSEPETGIILDNFSFRGITGVELKKLNNSMLSEMNEKGYYDLVIMQYGVNLMFKPNDTNYDYYYRAMKPIIKKLKTNFSKSEFLLVGASDRAFNYDGQWKTAVGIDSLIAIQAKLSYNNNIAFYNLYKSMGGYGTTVKWADSTLQLANKDYIHFNHRGARRVATMIFNALLNDFNKAVKKKQKNQVKPTVNKEV
ncbi:MAG: hypothetical protein H7239_07165 [Flavobacterium sp.]|nr:hypothetical protein [Flavobacterium sp.]